MNVPRLVRRRANNEDTPVARGSAEAGGRDVGSPGGDVRRGEALAGGVHRGLPLRRQAPLAAGRAGGARVRARLQRRTMPLQGDRGHRPRAVHRLPLEVPVVGAGPRHPVRCAGAEEGGDAQGQGGGAPRTRGQGRVASHPLARLRQGGGEHMLRGDRRVRPGDAPKPRGQVRAQGQVQRGVEGVHRASHEDARRAQPRRGARRRRPAGARPQGWRGVHAVPNQVLPRAVLAPGRQRDLVRPVPDPDTELRRSEAPGDRLARAGGFLESARGGAVGGDGQDAGDAVGA